MSETGWHLKREITWGHIVTTIVVAFSAITWGLSVDNRVSNNEKQLATLTELVQEHASQDGHQGAVIAMERLTTKLDALLERLERVDKRIQRQWDEINGRRPRP